MFLGGGHFNPPNIKAIEKQYIKIKIDPICLPIDGRHVSFFCHDYDGLKMGVYSAREQSIFTSVDNSFSIITDVECWRYKDNPIIQKSIDKLTKPEIYDTLKRKPRFNHLGISAALQNFSKKK